MNKVKDVLFIICGVIASYIVLLGIWSFMTSICTSSAAAAATRTRVYFGVADVFSFTPWLLFFLPAVVGMIAVIYVLKFKGR